MFSYDISVEVLYTVILGINVVCQWKALFIYRHYAKLKMKT